MENDISTLYMLCYEILILKTTRAAAEEKTEDINVTQPLKKSQSALSGQHQPEKHKKIAQSNSQEKRKLLDKQTNAGHFESARPEMDCCCWY
jgi:hypothetical protein